MRVPDVNSKKVDTCFDVSVIMTVCNQSETLPLVLSLLGEQDYTGKWELVITDDGSLPPALDRIAGNWQRNNVELSYVWQRKRGERRAATRNNGIRLSRGRIVVLLDGDMAVGRDFVSRHVARHDRNAILVYGTRRSLFLGDIDNVTSLDGVVHHLLFRQDLTPDPDQLAFQDKYAKSTTPWLACMSSNLSFTKVDVMFDEAFVGWGGEDQEFACRLAICRGYDLQFDRSLVGIHLDPGKSANAKPMRPESPSEIEQYLRNILHFYKSYPDLDMLAASKGLGYYSFNENTNHWERARNPVFTSAHIKSLLDRAEQWLGQRKPESVACDSSNEECRWAH